MELWIRSQDKTILSKVENLFLDDLDEREIRSKEFILLGQYETKKRALEVLNEIHQRLIDLQTLEYLQGTMNLDWKYNRSIDCVYEMPKD